MLSNQIVSFISFQFLLNFRTDFDCFPDTFFLSSSANIPVENSPKALSKKDKTLFTIIYGSFHSLS